MESGFNHNHPGAELSAGAWMPFKKYEKEGDGIGVKKFLYTKVVHLRNKTWWVGKALYKYLFGRLKRSRGNEKKMKSFQKLVKLYPPMEKNTGTVTIPLNVDISDKGQKVTVPTELLKEALKKTTFIAGMNQCLCRQSNDCKDFPTDLGCLFIGESSRSVVKYGLAREFTYEEAVERIEKAASLGLHSQTVWIEFEQPIWGIPNSEMDQFLEICFCCPCCCAGMRLAREGGEPVHVRFHPSGWTAVPDRTKCVGCGLCMKDEDGCPMGAISMGEDKKVVIDQDKCLGCGICAKKCKLDAIKIKQTMPMRDDILDYFKDEFNLHLDIYKKDEEAKNE